VSNGVSPSRKAGEGGAGSVPLYNPTANVPLLPDRIMTQL